MAQVVAYEIEVQADGKWRTLESFDPGELGDARSAMERLERDPPGSGLKLIEETLADDGLFKRRTIAFKRFEVSVVRPPQSNVSVFPRPAAPRKAERGDASRAPVGQRSRDGRRAEAGTGKRSGFGGSIADLLSFLFVPIRARTIDGEDGDATVVSPPVAVPTRLRGDVPVFDDEMALPIADVVIADATYRQFRAFFDALAQGGVIEAARRDLQFSRRISLFAIGVLFSIEQDINIFSDRGKAMVSSVLQFFIESHEAIGHFVQTMERYLTENDAPEAIRVGSKCFKLYQAADIAGMKRAFEEAFGITDKLEAGLGGKVKVGILFTDIVDSTALTSEIGDTAAQAIIEHHEEVVLDYCRRFGGRKVKHLGDGLMLSFANKERMVACAVGLVDAMKGLANRPDAPVYQMRCGGHFGEAIQKDDDFFGATVQLAARISAKAGANEACFSTLLFDRDLPTYAQFADKGATALKGIAQPVALAVYG